MQQVGKSHFSDNIFSNLSWQEVKANFKEVLSPQFYVRGVMGWSKTYYAFWAFGLVVLTYTGFFMTPFNGLSIPSWLGSIIGFTCVCAISNSSRLQGLAGLISATLIALVSIATGNYANAFMQFVYGITLDVGSLMLGDRWTARETHNMDKFGYIMMSVGGILLWVFLLFMDMYVFHSPRALIDSFEATLGVMSGMLLLFRYKSAYLGFTFSGIFSIVLWGMTLKSGHPDSLVLFFNYILYLMNDGFALTISSWSYKKKKD